MESDSIMIMFLVVKALKVNETSTVDSTAKWPEPGLDNAG